MGFTYALFVTNQAVVSYTAIPPLLRLKFSIYLDRSEILTNFGLMPKFSSKILGLAVYFCCTFLRVASTRRYLASCPMKPGLSSPAAFRLCSRDHPSYSLTFYNTLLFFCQSNLLTSALLLKALYLKAATTYKFSYK